MTQQRFRSDRLYKLLKFGVVLLTIFLILKLVVNQSMRDPFADIHGILDCNILYERGTPHNEDCKKKVVDEFKDSKNQPFKNILIIIAIPTLFFGGNWLYKYLLPLKEK